MLVDLFSGSYNEENIGHELLNDQKNPITGKYYGYLPPHDNPNILELGALSSLTVTSHLTGKNPSTQRRKPYQ